MSPKPQSSNYVAKAAESVSCSDSEGTAPSKRKRPAVEDLEQMSKAERRRTQIRLAQRAYRDRQSQYVKQLEAELNALKGNGGRSPRNTPPAPLAASAGPPHATAKLEEEREILGKQLKEAEHHIMYWQQRALAAEAEVEALRARQQHRPMQPNPRYEQTRPQQQQQQQQQPEYRSVSFQQPAAAAFHHHHHLQQPPPHQLKPQPSSSTTHASNNPLLPTTLLDGKIKSAVEIFGPLDIESYWRALKSLPSLQASEHLDTMFDLLSKKSYSSDTAEVRTLIIKLVDAKYKVMNACSPDDRMKAIEIMDNLEAKNANHMNHLSNSSSSSYSSPSSSVTSFGGNILPALTIPQPTVKQPTSSNYYQPLPFHPNQNHQQYLVGGNNSQNSGERAQPSRPQDLESRFRHAISRISTLAASSSATQEVNELCTISWLLSQSSNPSERDGFRQKLNECKTRLLDYVSRNGQEEDRVFLLRAFDEFCLNRW